MKFVLKRCQAARPLTPYFPPLTTLDRVNTGRLCTFFLKQAWDDRIIKALLLNS